MTMEIETKRLWSKWGLLIYIAFELHDMLFSISIGHIIIKYYFLMGLSNQCPNGTNYEIKKGNFALKK